MKVLVVDDTPDNCEMIRITLTYRNYEVLVASNGYEALEVLAENDDIQLAIIDWMMPKMDGIELVGRIRSIYSDRYIYVIMLSARDDRGDVVFGLESGVDDYMSKPYSNRELAARVSIGARVVKLETRLSQSLKEAERLAQEDHLTGLYNRRHFYEIATKHFQEAASQSRPLSVIMCDIDHFKRINDRFGHFAGDAVLAEFSRRSKAALPEEGVIARYGGEEFVILLPGHDSESAYNVAEQLRQETAGSLFETGEAELDVTVSAGVAALSDRDDNLDKLLYDADTALYSAKEQGRNQVIVFEAP